MLSILPHSFAKECTIAYNSLVKEINLLAGRQEDEQWDRKKIFLFFIIVGIILGLGVKTFVLGKNEIPLMEKLGAVKGLTTNEDSKSSDSKNSSSFQPSNLGKTLEDKVTTLTNEVKNINVLEVASSTPAIQKVINDLKNLQNYPQNQAKEACFKICEGL